MFPAKLLRSLSPFHTNSICFHLLKNQRFSPQRQRSLHITSSLCGTSYEHDGKTFVTVLNKELDRLMINGYGERGFKLNSGMQVIGPMIIFPKTVLGWDVASTEDITPESLALFSVLEPKPDVLVIGIGTRGAKLSLETLQFLRSNKLNSEILPTEHACKTFNFLCDEGRTCAAVMIPPDKKYWVAEELARSKKRRKELYETED